MSSGSLPLSSQRSPFGCSQKGLDSTVDVVEPPCRFSSGYVNGARPPHHLNDTQTKFCNPWPSFRFQSLTQWIGFSTRNLFTYRLIPGDVKSLVPFQTPTWGVGPQNDHKAKATWLGHACYLVEFPTPPGASRGTRIIFDPVLSEYCSPVDLKQFKRFTDAPCSMKDLPPVDVIVLSHNHYDHMDVPTLRAITESCASAPHIFVALNNAGQISKFLNLPRARVHELDWWDERVVRVALPAAKEGADKVQTQMRLTCTPSQHVSSRSAFDRWASLWAAWVVEELLPPQAPAERPPTPSHSSFTPTSGLWETVGKKLYFAGDTGYRTVHDGEDEDKVPVCPAFAEVGDRFGGIDVALLPIGAYGPRAMWSNLHASPGDAVRMMRDVKAKKALAMHWGTWVLTSEPVLEPPELLRKECVKAGIEDDEFLVPALGETVFF